jgi:hypothetical protein
VLDELFATASDDADIRRKSVSLESLEALVENMEPAVSALKALEPASKIKIQAC